MKYILMWVCCCFAALGQGTSIVALRPAHKDKGFTEYFRQTNVWSAGDVATSVPLSDGRVLWLFGDSYINQFDPATGTVPCLFDVRNAVLVQNTNDPAHFQALLNPKTQDRSFFRPPGIKDGVYWPCFWPGVGFQSGKLVYIYLTEMQQTGQGGLWGFKDIGQYWAKLNFPSLSHAGYIKLPSFNGILFWCGFVTDEKSGFTYAYGDKKRATDGDVYVARFPTDNPESAWMFWDGKGWNPDAAAAAIVTRATSMSVNVCKIGNKFLLVTTDFSVRCDQGRGIYVAVADNVTGPFSRLGRVFMVDDAVQGHYPFFYGAAPHPEYINAAGELLITYCINGYEPCVTNCVNGRMNPDYYRPRAIRVPIR